MRAPWEQQHNEWFLKGSKQKNKTLLHLFWEGCKEEETLSSQNFLIANVVSAWSAL